MASITQDMRYRLSLIKYAEKYGLLLAVVSNACTKPTFQNASDNSASSS